MRMMNELKHLFLYSASKKVYVPIDEHNKRKNSAILLLTPSLEVSNRLMTLPYLVNPNLFTSFYVDRNVSAYVNNMGIENIEFDEQEENAVSEAMIYSFSGSMKFNIDDSTSTMDTRYIREVYNRDTVKHFTTLLGIGKIPDKVHVTVHPTLASLKSINANNEITPYFSFNDDTIHVLSKMVYDPYTMCGTYNQYLISALLYVLVRSFNPKIHAVMALGIAYSQSGILKFKSEERNEIRGSKSLDLAYFINDNVNEHGYDFLQKYIKTADAAILGKLTLNNSFSKLRKLFREDALSYSERQRLLPSDFGIPEKRSYPIHNKDHVMAAIKMFNQCDPSDERELANAIIKRMKRFGITNANVSKENNFYKYYKKSGLLKEAVEDTLGDNWDEICAICNNLTSSELARITFTDSYENSKFVIKRIIARARINGEVVPVGFLDVYQFPSNPDIAQIVIAVDGRYRGYGAANTMVRELMKSDLQSKYGFKMYYWTAHQDNEASQHIALKNGFKDTGNIDKYGRKVFIYRLVAESKNDVIPFAYSEEDSTYSESAIITENTAIFFEADDKSYSQKLRRYLYTERIKNNKGVLLIYDKIKAMNPNIRKTYLKLDMYMGLNLFVDLSYYHGLFLKNNVYKLDKAVNLYFDFLNRLINNREITSKYNKTTIFIPIDRDVWSNDPDADVYDFRSNLNPISAILRLVRTNPSLLKKEWGNKDVVFVGSRGYFKVDFSKFDLKGLSRFKTNLRKLMSSSEAVVDDYEVDAINDDSPDEISSIAHSDSSAAIATKIIDKIENNTKIKINNVSALSVKSPASFGIDPKASILSPHMSIVKANSFDGVEIGKNDTVAIISLDPDGPNGFHDMAKTPMYNSTNKRINTYCMPK